MDRLLNALRSQSSALDQAMAQPRFAIVSSVDPGTGNARVMLQPEGTLSGWLPVLSPWTGSGWGMCCPPSPGDQVLVVSQEGAADHGIIVGRAYSQSQQCPNVQAGEFWLVHASGSFLKLTNSGTIEINGPLTISGTVTVVGDLHASGNVFDSYNSLADLRAHYNEHTHQDSRNGTTTTPNQQD